MLAAAGVLEFVNEQVADAVSNRESGVRWLVIFVFEHAESNLCDFDKVDHACFRKGDAKMSGGPAKQREAGAHDLPFLFGITANGCIRRRTRKRHFQALAQLIPVLAAGQNKGMHPAVAFAEHVHQQLLHLLPVVVAPQEERFSCCTHGRAGNSDFLKGTASRAAVKLSGLLCDFETASEAGDERLLQCEIAAEGVDGGDAQLRGQIKQIPAEALRMFESAPRQRAGVILAQLVEDAIAHLGGGGIRKGDRYNLARLVYLGKQAKKPLGKQGGFA